MAHRRRDVAGAAVGVQASWRTWCKGSSLRTGSTDSSARPSSVSARRRVSCGVLAKDSILAELMVLPAVLCRIVDDNRPKMLLHLQLLEVSRRRLSGVN